MGEPTKRNTDVAAIDVVGDGGLIVHEGLLALEGGPVAVVRVAALGSGEGYDGWGCCGERVRDGEPTAKSVFRLDLLGFCL